MSRHGDNFHESLVLVRAWGDAYPMGVIAGRHHQREPCRQYLSVVLANLCNFAQERERERPPGAMIGLGKGEPRGWPPSKLTTTADEGSFLRAPSLYGVCCSRWGEAGRALGDSNNSKDAFVPFLYRRPGRLAFLALFGS